MPPAEPMLLALDDDEQIAGVVCELAKRSGFNAMSVGSSAGFRKLLAQTRPDIVVLDLQLPDDDGVSVLRYLADTEIRPGILLVTGMDERTMAAAEHYGLSRGLRILGKLQKPFAPKELQQQLERALAAERPLTKSDLERAIATEELVLYYQPTIRRFVDGTWDVSCVEALLRWHHPVRGLLMPPSFIAMGEEHGLGRSITDFVLRRGIEQLKGWKAARLNIGLRINIAASLISDLEFPDRLTSMLAAQAIDADTLTLEVNEMAMLAREPDTFDVLTRLRLKNINLAIDDFGTGYSSLTQLFRMPFGEMKIDKSLVSRATSSRESSMMVEALISLAHKLGLAVCAKGVEDEQTLVFLNSIGCDGAQGSYIGSPVLARQVPKVIALWNQYQRQGRAFVNQLSASHGSRCLPAFRDSSALIAPPALR
jgi:EAL domain-containing protein (putative c-di-GMP-specific phosphodiesterase class I)/CheY-like chemotaxis protein